MVAMQIRPDGDDLVMFDENVGLVRAVSGDDGSVFFFFLHGVPPERLPFKHGKAGAEAHEYDTGQTLQPAHQFW